MTFFEQSVFFGVSISLAAYGIGVLLQKKFKFALFNPLLISVVLTIAVLLTAHISYDTFYEGAQYLSYLLTPLAMGSVMRKSLHTETAITLPKMPVMMIMATVSVT